MNRCEDWLRQAENDIEWAEHSLNGGFFAQVCFISQLAAEKALKAFCFHKGFDSVRTHSLFRIIRDLNENGSEKSDIGVAIFRAKKQYSRIKPRK